MTNRAEVIAQLERLKILAETLSARISTPTGLPTDQAICHYLDLILAANVIQIHATLAVSEEER